MKRIIRLLSCMTMLMLALAGPTSSLAKTDDFQMNYPPNMKPNHGMVQRIIAKMSPKEKIGQLVMPSTHDNNQQLPNEQTKKLLQEYKAGSVIIYGDRDSEKTAQYNNQLQEWANETRLRIPLFTSADLEYGAVQHVTDATTFPRQMGIAATGDLEAAKKVAAITAEEARAMGFNWNYSPVADVNTNPLNPVIGVRSFGADVDLVSDMTVAQVDGYQENGVIATAKHFPGHGDTSVDSHYGLASVTYDRETLENIHLPPFEAAIEAGVDSIMTAHVIIEAIDPELPATLSEKVLTGLLREELGFDGLIVTDAMSMDAIDEEWGSGQAAVMTIKAGADIVMATGTYEEQIETFEALLDAYQTGEISKKRIDDSLERILTKKIEYNLFKDRFVDINHAVETTNDPEHKQFANDIAQQSITLVKNDGVLPFDKADQATTLVVGPQIYGETYYMEHIAEAVDQQATGKVESIITSTNPSEQEIANVLQAANNVDRIIAATFSASELPAGQSRLVSELTETGKPTVAFSLGLPYDIQGYPEVSAYLASYAVERWGSPVPTSWNAAVDVIFGEQPGGSLPVSINDAYNIGTGLKY
ncbi:glycoside hydrolase family 3 protein [Sediminibacillus massiliensis]|uniref:glycoside hydrolase family 3 protein n=1 Tax=Sediminibacillus massiliensis TaxID=1926277 RepID=UPI00098850A2|nr:glycoside hydrolase family 3 protein [Sediminibacillus massiliensis]